jgi:hypothetical protein
MSGPQGSGGPSGSSSDPPGPQDSGGPGLPGVMHSRLCEGLCSVIRWDKRCRNKCVRISQVPGIHSGRCRCHGVHDCADLPPRDVVLSEGLSLVPALLAMMCPPGEASEYTGIGVGAGLEVNHLARTPGPQDPGSSSASSTDIVNVSESDPHRPPSPPPLLCPAHYLAGQLAGPHEPGAKMSCGCCWGTCEQCKPELDPSRPEYIGARTPLPPAPGTLPDAHPPEWTPESHFGLCGQNCG